MDSKRATANIKNVQSQLSKLEQKATSKTLINNLTMYQRELATVDKNLNELINAKLEGSEFEGQIQELIEHKQRIEQAAKNTLIEAEVDRVRRTYETKIKGKFSDKDAAVLEGSFNDLKQKHPESNVVEQFIQEARIAIADKLGVSAPQPSAPTVSAVTTTTTSTPLVAAKKETPIATAASSPAVQPALGSEAFFKNAAIAKIESQLDSAQSSASKPTSTAESALERAKGYLKDAQAKLSSEIEQFNYLDHFNQRYTAIRQQIAVTHAEKDLSAVEKKLVQSEQKVSKSLGSATFDKVIGDYDALISEVKDKKDTFSAIESQWQQLVEKHEQLSVQFQQKNKDVTAGQQQEEQLKFARSAIAHLESSLEIGKKETVDGSFPASIRVDFFSWARYNVSDAIGSSETKDYNVFTNIIHNCEVMERMNIEGTASELQALKDEAAKCHAMHCTQVCLTKQSDEYLQYLARFPKTRAYVLKRLREEIRYKQFAKAIHMLQTDKKYNFSDPVKTQPASLVDEPDNIEEWLKTDYKTVTPNSVNGQCGYMSFANALIPKNNSARQAEQTFTLGKDTHIYARCFWPQKINEIPIAYGPNNNLMQPPATLSPVFLHMELLLFLTVDGKRFERLDLPKKALAYMVEDSDRENSFYNDATTCQFGCFVSDLKLSGFIEDEWDLIPYRLTKLFSMLSAGNHKIEFDLCYRLVTHNYKVFPGFDTACSEPIAKGGFNLVIPNANAIQLADPVPTTTKTSLQLAFEDAQEAEKAIVDFLKQSAEWGSRADRTETIVSVQVTGTYIPVFERRIVGDRVVDVLVQYTLPFTLVSYRSPKKGWNRESVAVFELSAHTPRIDNVAPKIPPIVHVSVSIGASIDFDGEGVLTDNILNKYNLRDASLDENERRGFNPADLPANF